MLQVNTMKDCHQPTGDSWINFIAFLQVTLTYFSPYNFDQIFFKCTCEAHWNLGSFVLYKYD